MNSIRDAINELRSTRSVVDKRYILNKYFKDNEIWKNLLYLTYNPYMNSYISDTSFTNKVPCGSKTFDETFIEFRDLFIRLNTRVVTGNAAKEEINNFLAKCTGDAQDIYKLALTRDLKCGIAAKTINSVFRELIPEFNVQLASTYEPTFNYKVTNWYASPKMDGVRGVYSHNHFLSRRGREFTGLEFIQDQLNTLRMVTGYDMFDGELYIPGKDFNDIYSIIAGSQSEKVKEQVKFHIFLATNYDTTSTRDVIENLNYIKTMKDSLPNIEVVPYAKILNDRKSIEIQTFEYVKQGYEGIVLRHPEVFHSEKRDRNLVKHKFFKEVDVIVTGINEGDGKYSDTVGSLTYKGKIGDTFISGEVGSGLSDYDREHIKNHPNEYLGQVVTLKFQDLTPVEDNTSSLRFPVILGFKKDR